jgi:hypothetical protein
MEKLLRKAEQLYLYNNQLPIAKKALINSRLFFYYFDINKSAITQALTDSNTGGTLNAIHKS